MFKSIGIKLKNRKTLKAGSSRENLSYDKAKTAAILVKDFDKNVKTVDSVMKELKKDGLNVSLITYTKPKAPLPSVKVTNQCTSKDWNWLGSIKSEEIKKIIKTPFDYLFCLNTSPFLPFENILVQSAAKCRVGIYHPKMENSLDLMITPTNQDNMEKTASEMLRYVRMIKKY